MKVLFSARHKDALVAKRLKPHFPRPLHKSIARILDRYSDYGGWDNQENFTYDSAEEALKTFYGVDYIKAFKEEERVKAGFVDLILSGYPSEVLDAMEAWFAEDPRDARSAERDLNDALSIHRSHWRVVNGMVVQIDSDYLHEEVIAKSLRLMAEARASGPLEEFEKAVSSLQSDDCKNAVVEAHKSVESVMKLALESDKHQTYGQLLSELVKSRIVPSYYEDFLRHFEKLALGAVKQRNLPGGGHGQGAKKVDVPRGLAQFAVNLAGSINVFLIERWIETKPEPDEEEESDVLADFEDDVPF